MGYRFGMPLPDDLGKVRKDSVGDEVYSSLLALIVDGTLEPGERVRDKELAEALGVSRTPVREALKRLEDAGLVESSASRWTRVSPVDLREAEMLYPIVSALEALAISLAEGRMDEAELAGLAAANERLARALGEGDPVGAAAADRDFHALLVGSVGNPELARIWRVVVLKLRRVEVAYFGGCAAAEESVEEHARVVDALKVGDHARASEALKENYRRSVERAVGHLRVQRA